MTASLQVVGSRPVLHLLRLIVFLQLKPKMLLLGFEPATLPPGAAPPWSGSLAPGPPGFCPALKKNSCFRGQSH